MSKNNTSWNEVADWYDSLLQDSDSYQVQVVLPNILRLVSPVKTDEILDIACGQGFFSKALREKGARVSGIDLSPELIKIAEERVLGGNFNVNSADNLSIFKDNTFDKAICVLAMQNIENYKGAILESARVLKRGGIFTFVLNHPAFRIPKKSSWGFDEKNNYQYRRIDEYMSENITEIDMHPGEELSDKTISFHRPLQSYFKALEKAGFSVIRLEEWVSHKKSEKGPKQIAEDRARKEIPMFMCIQARKN